MYKNVISFLLFLSIVVGTIKISNATDTEKDAAIKEYQAIVPLPLFLGKYETSIGIEQAEEQSKILNEILAKVDEIEIRRALSISLKNHLTIDEIKALTRFMRSQEGRSIVKKIPLIEHDIAPVIDKQINHILKVYSDQQQKKME